MLKRLFVFTLFAYTSVLAQSAARPVACQRLFGGTGVETARERQSVRELFCPHLAARAVVKFAADNSADASGAARAVARKNSEKDWDYLRVSTAKIPGLTDEDNLDYASPHDVHLLYHPTTGGPAQATMWGHANNHGRLVHATNNLKAEGVSNLLDIRHDIAGKTFALVEYSGEGFRPDDVLWTNTLLINRDEMPRSLDFQKIKRYTEKVLAGFDFDEQPLNGNTRLILITVKNPAGEEFMVMFDVLRSQREGKLIGEVKKVTGQAVAAQQMLLAEFKKLGSSGRVYWFGDDLTQISRDFISAAPDLVRRSLTTVKGLGVTDSRLNQISARGLIADQTVLIQATPGTAAEIAAMGFPALSLDRWKSVSDELDEQLSGHFVRSIKSKEEFLKEVATGKSDVLFVVAHSDSKSLFLNGQEVTFAELEAMQDRQVPSARPRVAVLISCYAGNMTQGRRLLFWREHQSWAELLVNKGYFDQVLASDREIDRDKSVDLVQSVLKELRISLGKSGKGLWKIAQLFIRNRPYLAA